MLRSGSQCLKPVLRLAGAWYRDCEWGKATAIMGTTGAEALLTTVHFFSGPGISATKDMGPGATHCSRQRIE